MIERFRVEGLVCPSRVAHLLAPTLERDLRAALAQYGQVDSEVLEWIHAVRLEADRYENANRGEPPSRDASVNANAENQPPPGGDTILLSADEAGKELGCSASNVRALARNGRLVVEHVRPYLFARREVDRYKFSRKEIA